MSATRLNKATNNSGQMRLGVAVATASFAVEAQGPFTPPPPRQNWRELNRRVNSVQLCGHLADMSSRRRANSPTTMAKLPIELDRLF